MGSGARAALAVAFGIWAGAAGAGETIWEGAVRVVDAKTLAGVPDGPVLPLGGIEPPPPDAQCGPAAERPACRELAVLALRDVVAGQHLVCERRPPARSPGDSATRNRERPGKHRGQDRGRIACRAGGIDVAEWMVRMGWALAGNGKLREAEREARAAREGMWWFEEESFAQAHGDAPPVRYAALPLPGEDVVRACMEAGGNAFARREYGNLMAIEAVEWLIEETRLRWERRHAMEEDGADVAPEALDPETRESLDAARKLCGLLGAASEGSGGGAGGTAGARRPGTRAGPASEGSGGETGDTSGEAIETLEGRVGRLADRARETCREAAAEAARTGRIEDLTNMRQIARHTMLRTERLGERLWRARGQGDDEEARRTLARAYTVFESAERQCRELAED